MCLDLKIENYNFRAGFDVSFHPLFDLSKPKHFARLEVNLASVETLYGPSIAVTQNFFCILDTGLKTYAIQTYTGMPQGGRLSPRLFFLQGRPIFSLETAKCRESNLRDVPLFRMYIQLALDNLSR